MRHRAPFDGDDDAATGAGPGHPHDDGRVHRTHVPVAGISAVLDHGPDGVGVHQNGRFVYVNAVAARWLGARSARELIGLEVSSIVHTRSLPLVLAGVASLHRPGDVSPAVRATVVRADGADLDVEVLSTMTTWDGADAYQLVLRDLSERRGRHEALARQAALVDDAGDAVISTTRSGLVTSWNPAAARLYRRPAHLALASPIERALGTSIDLAAAAERGVVHAAHHAMDGSLRRVRVGVTGSGGGYVLICSDESTLHRSARNLRTAINALQTGVLVVDPNGWVQTVNLAARRIIGRDHGDGDAERRFDFHDLDVYDADGELLPIPDRPVSRAMASGLPTIGRVVGVDRPDGARVWLSLSCQPLYPAEGQRSPILVSFHDVTAQRATTEHLAFQAAHDALTGLPNRNHILETINALHHDAGVLRAVLFIDVDDLKTVNDTFGHEVGDLVLQTTASRLCRAVRGDDVVGRLSGDEFVALLVGDLRNGALDRFVDRIRRVLAEPVHIPGGTLHLGASIGVVDTDGHDERDANTLLRDADAAMYEAKATGRRVSVFAKH
ncbi:diguanylate cyclase [Mycolicibacterium sediminis]|uniref:Diguanylate cyclase n=1 Tax=Mycolicibacterium sediminis TaxID=1286180 RepID=A0A7I7QMY9_9MYCO|nr:diguanylate cyclase [Mycolicibacterium sediminis]BBY27662.1 hypothetical protein MSEDJ_17580 [Mycolicibacterium sediminis]